MKSFCWMRGTKANDRNPFAVTRAYSHDRPPLAVNAPETRKLLNDNHSLAQGRKITKIKPASELMGTQPATAEALTTFGSLVAYQMLPIPKLQRSASRKQCKLGQSASWLLRYFAYVAPGGGKLLLERWRPGQMLVFDPEA